MPSEARPPSHSPDPHQPHTLVTEPMKNSATTPRWCFATTTVAALSASARVQMASPMESLSVKKWTISTLYAMLRVASLVTKRRLMNSLASAICGWALSKHEAAIMEIEYACLLYHPEFAHTSHHPLLV